MSRSESELNEIYQMLTENLYLVSAAFNAMEMSLKTNLNNASSSANSSFRSETVTDIITTL